MATKHLINLGIGFSPGKPQYIVTLGLEVGAFVDIWTETTPDSANWSETTPDSGIWTPTTPDSGVWT